MSHESVTAIILNDQKNKVLLIKRLDTPVWALPGGAVDPGESPETAVLREVLEETGLKGQITRKIAKYTPINRLATVTHLFECQTTKAKLLTGNETKDIAFFSISSLPKNFFHIHHEMLTDALNHEEYTEKKLSSVTYWNLVKYFFCHPIRLTRFVLSKAGIPINR